MKETIVQFWQQRTHAERRTLLSAGTLLVVALLYAFIWHPVTQARQQLQTSLPQLRAAAAQMQRAAIEVTRLRTFPQKDFNGNLNNAVEYAALHSPIGAPSAVLVLDSGRTRVTFNAVAFDHWIDWVKTLQSDQGIRVESAAIFALTEPGMVKIQAVLSSSSTNSNAR